MFKIFQVLLLHKNRIVTLHSCERYLPAGLSTLTLNDNQISELTDVAHLAPLATSLEQLTVANNPAIEQPEDLRKQFDYRPYVINWCLGLRVLDGMLVGAKERWVLVFPISRCGIFFFGPVGGCFFGFRVCFFLPHQNGK